MISFMKRNTGDDGIFYNHEVYGIGYRRTKKVDRNSYIALVDRIKSQLRGDVERGGVSYRQSKEDKLGRQRVIPFNKGEVNTSEEFLNLLDFITNSLGILGIDNSEIEILRDRLTYRVKHRKEEKARRANYTDCPRCGERGYKEGDGCADCGYIEGLYGSDEG
jgi:hypothetical protein